jgi:DNA-directed RNA polymerase beta subunit
VQLSPDVVTLRSGLNMQSQPNGATRERVDFSKIKASIPIPNLIEVQKKSYERFSDGASSR